MLIAHQWPLRLYILPNIFCPVVYFEEQKAVTESADCRSSWQATARISQATIKDSTWTIIDQRKAAKHDRKQAKHVHSRIKLTPNTKN